jgi:sec-independent protein translocase protein TatA
MFDPSAPHIIILLVVVLLLFGASRLPGAAEALGKSMHIFRRSVKGQDDQQGPPGAQATIVQPGQAELPTTSVNQSQQAQQAQIDALQRQLDDLQRRDGGVPAEPQQSQKPV